MIDLPRDLVTLDEMERCYISHVLEATGGNRSAAARFLGITRWALYRRLKNGLRPVGDIAPQVEPPDPRAMVGDSAPPDLQRGFDFSSLQHPSLSRREQQVMEMLAHGMLNQEVAAQLGISIRTVDTFHYRAGRSARMEQAAPRAAPLGTLR